MTFEELFNKYESVSIPLIQRDYVQGRAVTDRQKEDRQEFIHNLFDATLQGAPSCHLDFIYGSCDESGSFLPLDGQQRLTTLFIMHWLLLNKCDLKTKDNGLYRERKVLLEKFTYKTRLSSEKFCKKLLEKELILESESDPVYKAIRYQSWFNSTMSCDPTVQAILEMIHAMECTLEEENYRDRINEMEENLANGDCITFSLLDLDRYKLTDALYVKMNARGKELTPFENWKAEFIDYLGNNAPESKEIFKDRIEHDWHDLFWPEVYDQCRGKKDYPRIDERFMCYFNNMHRLQYFLVKGVDTKADSFRPGLKSQQDEVYSQKDINGNHHQIQFLFDSLDWLYRIEKQGGVDSFFCALFQNNTDISSWEDKVFLFGDGNEELNLFRRFSNPQKTEFEGYHVLLYAIIMYGINTGSYKVDADFKDYVRQCRNYLENLRYFDRSKLVMQPQVRANRMADYHDEFVNYMGAISHPSSMQKWLEDLPYTLGNAAPFQTIISDVNSGALSEADVKDAVVAFDSADTVSKIKILITFGFTGIQLGGWCSYGERVFFGSNTSRDINARMSHWDVVFCTKNQSLNIAIDAYVRAYSKNKNLSALIRKISYPASVSDYFLKYTDILAAQLPWRSNNPNDAFFFFAMKSPMKTLDMIAIHSYSGNPLAAAYQVCPMANAVARKLSFYPAKYLKFAGHAADKAGVCFKDKAEENLFRLLFKSNEWVITNGLELITDNLKDKYSIGEDAILRASDDKDLIEVAVMLLEDMQPILVKTGLLLE